MPGVNTDTTDTRLIDFIDKMKLSNGSVVWLGDNWAREKIDALTNPLQYLGKTTTDITTEPGKSSPTVTIGGVSVTAPEGGIVLYDMTIAGKTTTIEAIWNGSIWEEFGSRGTLGTLAFKDTATGTTTYQRTTNVTFPNAQVNTSTSTYTAGKFLTDLQWLYGTTSYLPLTDCKVLTTPQIMSDNLDVTLITQNKNITISSSQTIPSTLLQISETSTFSTYTTDGKLSVNIAGGGASFSGTEATLAKQSTIYYGVFASVSNSNGVATSQKAHWATYQPAGSISTGAINVAKQTTSVVAVSSIRNVVQSFTVTLDATDTNMLVFTAPTTAAITTQGVTVMTDATATMGALSWTGTTSYFRSSLEWTTDSLSSRFDTFFEYAAINTAYTPEGGISGITGEATAYLRVPSHTVSLSSTSQVAVPTIAQVDLSANALVPRTLVKLSNEAAVPTLVITGVSLGNATISSDTPTLTVTVS